MNVQNMIEEFYAAQNSKFEIQGGIHFIFALEVQSSILFHYFCLLIVSIVNKFGTRYFILRNLSGIFKKCPNLSSFSGSKTLLVVFYIYFLNTLL